MKKYLLILLSLSVLFVFCSCSDKPDGGNDHLEYFTGKVIEIKDDNTILIQITEERGGYKVDDKVYVYYDQAIKQDKSIEFDNSNGILDSSYKPIIGDEIFAQSFYKESEKKDGYDYRKNAGPIFKYVDINESSENND